MIFSIVIPTYNNLKELKKCLNGLDRLTGNIDFEVIIGIDGSTDGTIEYLAQSIFSFSHTFLSHADNANQGRAKTRNLSLGKMKGRFVLFLDSDMVPNSDLLEKHLKILETQNTISIGHIHYHNSEQNIWAKYVSSRGVGKYQHGENVKFNYFITANSAIPREWFERLGGFDENISGYGGEDMELSFRLHQAFTPHYIANKEAVCSTVQSKSMEDALLQLREYGSSGLPYIIRKHPALNFAFMVNKCDSERWHDRIFEWIAQPKIRKVIKSIFLFLPQPMQFTLINYLVISYIHEGYQKAIKAVS